MYKRQVLDDRRRLGRLLLVGGYELLVFFCVEDAVGGGGSQPLGAIVVEWGVVPGLDHQIAGLDFARAGLGYVVGSWSCRTYSRLSVITNNKAESNRKKGKGRAQITARRTESRTKRARHRKTAATRQKATEKRQTARTDNSEKHGKQNEKSEAQKKTAVTREEQRQ